MNNQKIESNEAFNIVLNEGHTLGTIIQHYLLCNENVTMARYNVPHPLENKIEISFIANDPKETLNSEINAIKTDLEILKNCVIEAYKKV
jgi:DNA-directed RNA polymerase subunit L